MPLAEHDDTTKYIANFLVVSIHVPLAEHDQQTTGKPKDPMSFNSRAPRGARRYTSSHAAKSEWFQFTCPSRSTTPYINCNAVFTDVSIHVPLAEHDERKTTQSQDK